MLVVRLTYLMMTQERCNQNSANASHERPWIRSDNDHTDGSNLVARSTMGRQGEEVELVDYMMCGRHLHMCPFVS